jgi:hypothetical protein
MLDPAPIRAFYSVPSGVGVRADHAVLRPATNRAAVLLIETDQVVDRAQINKSANSAAGNGPDLVLSALIQPQ